MRIEEGPREPSMEPEALADEDKKRNPAWYSPVLSNEDFVALDLGDIPPDELITVSGEYCSGAGEYVYGTLLGREVGIHVIRVHKMWDRHDERLPLHPMN